MSEFNRLAKIPGYNMKKHLADTDPHPMYLKNTTAAIAGAIDNYLSDHPVTVAGVLNNLTDVTITSPTNGQVLRYQNGIWVNGTGLEGAVTDVTINGVSIVENKVAEIPNATTGTAGAVRFASSTEISNGSSSNVAVTPDNVKTMINSFKDSANGGIVVFIDDNLGKWSINGGSTWNNSGTYVELAAGTYTVVFQSVTGYTDPENISVTVIKGEVLSVNAAYAPINGQLQVTNSPAAKWSINGSTWNDSGAIIDLEAGMYNITFQDYSASYNVPEAMSVNIVAGVKTVVTKTYADATGKLSVNIYNTPDGSPGGWGVTGGGIVEPQVGSGTIELSPGTYTVIFADIEGCDTPVSQTVVVTRGQTTVVTASYKASHEPVYGVRYYDPSTATPIDSGNSLTSLTGIILDRDDGSKRILGATEAWPAGTLTAHDFHKCLVKNGAVNYYLDPADSTKKFNGTYNGKTTTGGASVLTGADGDVMVEIQPVYFRVDYVGIDAVGNSIFDWLISKEKFDGSVLHPYFRVGRSATTDERPYVQYLGAYESVLCTSAGVGVSTAGITSPNAYSATGNNRCRSIKGFKPVTNMTLAQFRDAHAAAGLHSMNSLAMQFLALMMFIEYRSLNSQEDANVNDTNLGCAGNRSDGFVWYNKAFAYQYVRKTGRADAFGNNTGEVTYVTATDYTNDNQSLPDDFNSSATGGKKVVGFTYRGIENPFGHIFKFEDGILTYSGGYYLTDMPSKYTSTVATAQAQGSGYTTYEHVWPASGYIKTFEFSESMPTFFAKSTGGSDTTYLPDYWEDQLSYDCVGVNVGEITWNTLAGIVAFDAFQVGNIQTRIGSRSAFSIVAG